MPLRHSVRLLAIRATGAPLGRAREVLETIGIRLPACFTTRAALTLPAGDKEDRSDLSRRACRDAAMPVAKELLLSHLILLETPVRLSARLDVTEWRKSLTGRLPSSRPSCEPVLADARPTSGCRNTLARGGSWVAGCKLRPQRNGEVAGCRKTRTATSGCRFHGRARPARIPRGTPRRAMQSFEYRSVRYWSKEINGTLTGGRKK